MYKWSVVMCMSSPTPHSCAVYSLSVDPLKYSEEDGDDDVAVGVEVGMGSVKDGMQGGVTEGDLTQPQPIVIHGF